MDGASGRTLTSVARECQQQAVRAKYVTAATATTPTGVRYRAVNVLDFRCTWEVDLNGKR